MRNKLKSTLLAASLSGVLGLNAHAQGIVPGYLKFEAWAQAADGTPAELAGADLQDATLLPLIPTFGAPEVLYMNSFNTRSVYPDDSHNNYLARITGVITVPETADYHVYVRSDDDSRVYLNRTGETPPNIESGTEVPLIKEDQDCCDGFIQPGLDTDGDGFGDSNADGSANTDAEATTVTPIRLTAGQRYGITVLLKEGGGGDWLELDVRKVGDTRPNAPLTSASIGTAAPALAVTEQPVATTNATENFPITLSVRPRRLEYPGVTYQWRANGTAIPGATNETLTVTPTLANDNVAYSVVLTAGGASVTSANSVVDVVADTTAPTILSAGSFVSRDAVVVNFSEPIGTGLGTAGNYTLNGGATVSSATAVGSSAVLLRTSQLTAGQSYTVTASNLRDLASGGGNALTANTVTFTQIAPPAGTALNIAEATRYVGATLDGLDDTIAAGTEPDALTYVGAFEAPLNVADGYTGRVRGYFIPPVSGNYVFFGASDDAGRYFLSTDSDPANKKLIGQETSWSSSRQWLSGGADPNARRSDRFTGTQWPGGNTINLVGGVPYYMELRFQEGGGGDNGEMTFKLEGEPDPLNGTPSRITGTNLLWYADVSTAAPIVVRAPRGTNFNKGARIVLDVQAIGQTPITYQWHRNKLPIEGATSATYTIESADHRHIGDYSVVLSNPAGVTHTLGADNSARLIMNGAFVIEAEDYNYDTGKHLPAASTMPLSNSMYQGLLPVDDIDFYANGNLDTSDAGAYAYGRHTSAEDVAHAIKGPNDPADYNRGSFTVTQNYAVGWTDVGEWMNYTRTFPAGRYAIYTAAAHDGLPVLDGAYNPDANNEINLILSRVANPTVADGSTAGTEGGAQGLTKLGSFLSKATGAWSSNDLIPLTDDNGNLVEVQLSGTQTLRLTYNEADGDTDYFLLYCLDCQSTTRPQISIARNAGNVTITSDSPGTVQATTSLTTPITWTDLGPAPQTVPTSPGVARFFRVRQ